MHGPVAGGWTTPLQRSAWLPVAQAARSGHEQLVQGVPSPTFFPLPLAPSANAPPPHSQVGAYFSRFGRVMDVVLVKDFGTLLHLASQATELEKQRAAAGEMLGRHFARERVEGGMAHSGGGCHHWQVPTQDHTLVIKHGPSTLTHHHPCALPAPQPNPHTLAPTVPLPGAYQKRAAKAEERLKQFMQTAEDVIDKAGCPTKAIFVTFSTQAERAACEEACPRSELSCCSAVLFVGWPSAS